MNSAILRVSAAALLAAGLSAASVAASLSCHLHAPGDYRPFGDRPLVIPSVGDPPACDNLNQERFGGRGWCHCIRDSLGTAPKRLPGIPASGGRDPMRLP